MVHGSEACGFYHLGMLLEVEVPVKIYVNDNKLSCKNIYLTNFFQQKIEMYKTVVFLNTHE